MLPLLIYVFPPKSPVAHADTRSRDADGNSPLDGIDLESVRNETLATLLDSALILHKLGGTTVVRLLKSLVMKAGGMLLPETEALSLSRLIPTFELNRSVAHFNSMTKRSALGKRGIS